MSGGGTHASNISRRRPMSEINVVPYVDVTLVLLVIFMVTAPLLTQGVLVELPKAPSEPITDTADDPLVISIRADGAIFVNLGIQSAADEGTRVTVYSLEDQAAKVLRARPGRRGVRQGRPPPGLRHGGAGHVGFGRKRVRGASG